MAGTGAICYMTRGVKSNTSAGCYYLSTCFIIRFEANERKQFFMCLLERVARVKFVHTTLSLKSLSLPLHVLVAFMDGYPTQSWASCFSYQDNQSFVVGHALQARWQMCPKVVHVFDFCCVCVNVRVCACVDIWKYTHTHMHTHTFAPQCYVRYTFVNPSKSLRLRSETNLIKALRAFDFP